MQDCRAMFSSPFAIEVNPIILVYIYMYMFNFFGVGTRFISLFFSFFFWAKLATSLVYRERLHQAPVTWV